MESKPLTDTKILGVKVNTSITLNDVMKRVELLLEDNKCHYISTTNPEFIMEAQKDPEFLKIINESDISVPDGSGVLMASKYLNGIANLSKSQFLHKIYAFLYGVNVGFSSLVNRNYLDNRVSGVELVYEICDYASKNGKNIFLLGGWPKDKWGRKIDVDYDLAEKAASVLSEKYPGLNIIGATSAFKPTQADDAYTFDYIHNAMKSHSVEYIDFLFVAYGAPHQEKWIVRNMNKIPAKVCMGVGGTFDYIAQTQKRSPAIFIKFNLEWLYKLVTQPWRIKRIVKAFPTFPLYVYLNSVKNI